MASIKIKTKITFDDETVDKFVTYLRESGTTPEAFATHVIGELARVLGKAFPEGGTTAEVAARKKSEPK